MTWTKWGLTLGWIALVCACAQVPTAASRDAAVSTTAELLARSWGAERGSSREALAQGVMRGFIEDPVLREAWKSKPLFTSDEAFWNQLQKEGSAMLPDEALRRNATLLVNMLETATPDECVSYQSVVKSGAPLGVEGEKWRRRLARASDDDFMRSMQFSKDAVSERVRRLNERPLTITRREYEAAFGRLMLALPMAEREAMMEAVQREDAGSNSQMCRFAAHLFRVQSELSGSDVHIPLRLFYATVKD